MDILRKFRYNFHYWLRNCYQAEEVQEYKKDPAYSAPTTNFKTDERKVPSKSNTSDIVKNSVNSIDHINSPLTSATGNGKESAPATQKVRSDKYMVL